MARIIAEKTTVYTPSCNNGFKKVHAKPSTDPLYLPLKSLKSRSGIYYTEYDDFLTGMRRIFGEDYEQMCRNAGKYIQEFYAWDKIMEKVKAMIEIP